MVAPNRRSRSKRRVKVVTPGGRNVTHYRQRKHAAAECGKCRCALQAVVTGNKAVMHGLSKSERRPCRPYGGVLCSACSRAAIKARVRLQGMR